MPWFYEIRDSNHVVVSTGKGFDTDKAAMAAGRKKARELKASSSLPSGGIATVKAVQDSEVLAPIRGEKILRDKELMAGKVDAK
jgi:hypothetical protein